MVNRLFGNLVSTRRRNGAAHYEMNRRYDPGRHYGINLIWKI